VAPGRTSPHDLSGFDVGAHEALARKIVPDPANCTQSARAKIVKRVARRLVWSYTVFITTAYDFLTCGLPERQKAK
jgi:hypothetical protein